MQPEVRQSLSDILSACDEIVAIAGIDARAYTESRRDGLAIERLFEILGEAVSRLRISDPQVFASITSGLAIIGMRNLIAHGYDTISAERVVSTIKERLPQLRDEVATLLQS